MGKMGDIAPIEQQNNVLNALGILLTANYWPRFIL